MESKGSRIESAFVSIFALLAGRRHGVMNEGVSEIDRELGRGAEGDATTYIFRSCKRPERSCSPRRSIPRFRSQACCRKGFCFGRGRVV